MLSSDLDAASCLILLFYLSISFFHPCTAVQGLAIKYGGLKDESFTVHGLVEIQEHIGREQ